MIIGIVGSEEAKFTEETKEKALEYIAGLLEYGNGIDLEVASGDCHLGGIDKWTREMAEEYGYPFYGYPPKTKQWSTGYRPRNVKIAKVSDKVVCITLKELPPGYDGMRFDFCYHCRTSDHVKSGGCWTMKYAASIGKATELIVI